MRIDSRIAHTWLVPYNAVHELWTFLSDVLWHLISILFGIYQIQSVFDAFSKWFLIHTSNDIYRIQTPFSPGKMVQCIYKCCTRAEVNHALHWHPSGKISKRIYYILMAVHHYASSYDTENVVEKNGDLRWRHLNANLLFLHHFIGYLIFCVEFWHFTSLIDTTDGCKDLSEWIVLSLPL